jgi:hypothetical protein
MNDEDIERLLLDIFRHWFRNDNLQELLNEKIDAESILQAYYRSRRYSLE